MNSAWAQDAAVIESNQIVAVSKGERVPYDGIIFSDAAVAKLKAKMETADDSCKIRLDHDKAVSDAELQYVKSVSESKLQLCQETATAKIDFRDSEIESMTKQIDKLEKRRNTSQLYFAGGVVSGIALTVLAGWAIGQAAQ